jgi:hypothetical protein
MWTMSNGKLICKQIKKEKRSSQGTAAPPAGRHGSIARHHADAITPPGRQARRGHEQAGRPAPPPPTGG